ncbi:MAG: hypothetical protein OEV66_07000 [Spirochaetia bacterium]|nr:hypothetical protein [Spirochaetia bacterium]
MRFIVQLFLNILFFFLYAVIGLKGADELFLFTGLDSENNLSSYLSWGKFFLVFIFFIAIALLSVSTTYAILREKPRLTKGEPSIAMDGQDETPETVMDLIDDRAGKISVEPPKVNSTKKTSRTKKTVRSKNKK